MKQNIISTLLEFDKDELEIWYNLSIEEQEEFTKDLAIFAEINPEEIKQFCLDIPLKEDSCIIIVYNALSQNSTKFSAVIYDEIKRLITAVKRGEYQLEILDLLWEIDLDKIAENDFKYFKEINNLLIYELQNSYNEEFKEGVASLLNYYFIYLDQTREDHFAYFNEIKPQLEILIESSNKKVKKELNKILYVNTVNYKLYIAIFVFLILVAVILYKF